MIKNLLIVESPNKIKKIQSFLNTDEWNVTASVGHVRDLRTYGTPLRLGIDLTTFEPLYINLTDKKDVLKKLFSAAKKSKTIYLATDPDREGEAIAWHLEEILKEQNPKAKFQRIVFNEITKPAIIDAIKHPTTLNMDLINSQEARRMLDRMIGFRLSFLTQKKLSARSAGRVKSSTLKIIIDREEEIKKFIETNWWTIDASFTKELIFRNVDAKKFSEIKYQVLADAEEIIKQLSGELTFVKRLTKTTTIQPPLPLEMATYLIGMFSNYKMSNISATISAQSLYEQGLISYPRTDSTRISSQQFLLETKQFINHNFNLELFDVDNKQKDKKANIQDAHEAIRPTDINLTPQALTSKLKPNERKAYEFIWKTTIKSFLPPSKSVTVTDIYRDLKHFFSTKNAFISFPGFQIVDGIQPSFEQEIKKQYLFSKNLFKPIAHKTIPPAHYNQATLIKKMKDVGIGRPSTYSSTTTGLIKFGYLDSEKGNLIPTLLAVEVHNLLSQNFGDIIDEKYTAKMETGLDNIADGTENRSQFLSTFWVPFSKRVIDADQSIPQKPVEYVGRTCPSCNEGELIYKRGIYGRFIGCQNYPKCKYIEKLTIKKPAIIVENEKCPICGKQLVVRTSKFKNKFIGCLGYPDCNYIMETKRAVPILLNMELIDIEESEKMLKKAQAVANKKT